MKLNEYQERSKRTLNTGGRTKQDLVANMIVGAFAEFSEAADAMKKWMWQGHELDLGHVNEELGDTLWYIANLCNILNLPLEEVAIDNIEKLYRRYPDGFDAEKSINREC